jgi:hypothetical protein
MHVEIPEAGQERLAFDPAVRKMELAAWTSS